MKHFRFSPEDYTAETGVFHTPLMGEVEVGRIYAVDDPNHISACETDTRNWQAVSKKDYEAQEKADGKEES